MRRRWTISKEPPAAGKRALLKPGIQLRMHRIARGSASSHEIPSKLTFIWL